MEEKETKENGTKEYKKSMSKKYCYEKESI